MLYTRRCPTVLFLSIQFHTLSQGRLLSSIWPSTTRIMTSVADSHLVTERLALIEGPRYRLRIDGWIRRLSHSIRGLRDSGLYFLITAGLVIMRLTRLFEGLVLIRA